MKYHNDESRSVIEQNLGAHVYPLVNSLFERFGVTGISAAFVDSELDRMRRNNFGERR